ncbi:MAG TPA: EamA family transporter [Spirochaetia bacterium]|nr:EamA family transporter [Spirochaetia bacterium]
MKKIFFALLCLIWGSTWLAIKIGLAYFPPFTFAAIRFALATLVVYGAGLWRHEPISWRWSDLRGAVWFGIFNGVDYALIFWAEQYIPSGLTSIINAALPFFSLIFACLLAGEKVTLVKGLGLLAGFCGVVLIFGGDVLHLGRGSLAGQTAVLLSTVSYALGATLAKRYQHKLGLLEQVTVQMGVTTLVIAVPAVLLERGQAFHLALDGVAVLLYLALVGSVGAFLLYFWLLERMEVSRLSYISMITPVIAVFLGAWWGHERVLWEYLAGLTVIMTGVWIVNRPQLFTRPTGDGQDTRTAGGWSR